MKIEQGGEDAQHFVDVMSHEFNLCEKAFEKFFLMAESNILGNEKYELLESLYESYSAFLTHLYEFYVACFKRDRQNTDRIHHSELDQLFTFETQKLMNNICSSIERGSAPAWVNDISYYRERIPNDFGKKFRDIRNNSSHVDLRRSSGEGRPTLKEFMDDYHKFVYILYDSARYQWSNKHKQTHQVSHIKEFSFSSLATRKRSTDTD